jgi:hypothetical protein
MARTPHAKRAKVSVYRPKDKKHRAGSGSIVDLTPTLTRRGKIRYTEVDATSRYNPSDEEGDSPKRKTPSSSRTPVPPLLEDTFQGEASWLDDQEPCVPKTAKVRLRFCRMVEV